MNVINGAAYDAGLILGFGLEARQQLSRALVDGAVEVKVQPRAPSPRIYSWDDNPWVLAGDALGKEWDAHLAICCNDV
jgi:hypothetical protein